MSMTYSCSGSKRSPGRLVKRGLPGQEGQCPSDIYPPRMGMYIWAWLVEEYVRAHRLGRCPTILSWSGLASWNSWTQPMVPTISTLDKNYTCLEELMKITYDPL